MKIEFLDEDCTEAIITRGWLRRRQARVCLTGRGNWEFADTQRAVAVYSYDLERLLHQRRNDTLELAQQRLEWIPVRSKQAMARLVLR